MSGHIDCRHRQLRFLRISDAVNPPLSGCGPECKTPSLVENVLLEEQRLHQLQDLDTVLSLL